MSPRSGGPDRDELSTDRWRLETQEPDDVPVTSPYEDPDDPDYLPEEDEEYPGEDEEYGAPAVAPHEEPLVTP